MESALTRSAPHTRGPTAGSQELGLEHEELPWRIDSRIDDDTEIRWSRRGDRMTAEITNHTTGDTATRTIWGIDELDK